MFIKILIISFNRIYIYIYIYWLKSENFSSILKEFGQKLKDFGPNLEDHGKILKIMVEISNQFSKSQSNHIFCLNLIYNG